MDEIKKNQRPFFIGGDDCITRWKVEIVGKRARIIGGRNYVLEYGIGYDRNLPYLKP